MQFLETFQCGKFIFYLWFEISPKKCLLPSTISSEYFIVKFFKKQSASCSCLSTDIRIRKICCVIEILVE